MTPKAEPIPGSDQEIVRRRDEQVRAMVTYCYERSRYYRDKLDEAGVKPSEVRGVDELDGLPVLMRKDDERMLQEQSAREAGHPFGEHLCVDRREVVAVSSTSGTTGTPTFYAFTAEDVAVTDELWARGLRQAGIGPESIVLTAFGLSMFLAGYPLARAVERMGAEIVPVGAEAKTDKLLSTAALVKPTALLCTPSYATYLIDRAPEQMAEMGLRSILCAGEPGAGLPEVRQRIESGTGATVYDALGGAHGILNVSDGAIPYDGMTVLSDDCSVQQLVDPDTGDPVAIPDDGTPAFGERVKTTLRWRAQPQLRTSVGDIYEMRRVVGSDGAAETRIKVIGRTDDLLIVKGVKLYPAAVRDLVAEFIPRAGGEFRIVLSGPPPRVEPPLRLRVERGPEAGEAADEELAADLANRMSERLQVRPQVEVISNGALERTTHKAKFIEREGSSE